MILNGIHGHIGLYFTRSDPLDSLAETQANVPLGESPITGFQGVIAGGNGALGPVGMYFTHSDPLDSFAEAHANRPR